MKSKNKYFDWIKAYLMEELSFEDKIDFLTEVALCPDLEAAVERATIFKHQFMADLNNEPILKHISFQDRDGYAAIPERPVLEKPAASELLFASFPKNI